MRTNTDAVKPPRRIQMENSVVVTVDAGIDEVWNVVRDVTRVGEWSHECVGAAWLGDANSAVPGARFCGRNRAGIIRWGRVCEILSAEPHELVWANRPNRAVSGQLRVADHPRRGRRRYADLAALLRPACAQGPRRALRGADTNPSRSHRRALG